MSASIRDLLSRKEAAAHLSSLGYPVSHDTLRRLADQNTGPSYQRFLKRIVRYERRALEQWAESQTSRFEGSGA